MDREAWRAAVGHDWVTELTELKGWWKDITSWSNSDLLVSAKAAIEKYPRAAPRLSRKGCCDRLDIWPDTRGSNACAIHPSSLLSFKIQWQAMKKVPEKKRWILILGQGGTLEAKKKWERLQRKISKKNSNMFR